MTTDYYAYEIWAFGTNENKLMKIVCLESDAYEYLKYLESTGISGFIVTKHHFISGLNYE